MCCIGHVNSFQYILILPGHFFQPTKKTDGRNVWRSGVYDWIHRSTRPGMLRSIVERGML
jgi:hypothetical protein